MPPHRTPGKYQRMKSSVVNHIPSCKNQEPPPRLADIHPNILSTVQILPMLKSTSSNSTGEVGLGYFSVLGGVFDPAPDRASNKRMHVCCDWASSSRSIQGPPHIQSPDLSGSQNRHHCWTYGSTSTPSEPSTEKGAITAPSAGQFTFSPT